MAKKTINEIKKHYVAMQKSAEDAAAELGSIRKQIAAKKAENEAAAKSGNEESYLQGLEDLKRLEAREYIQIKKMDQINRPWTNEEVKDAWADYVADYNKQFEKAMKHYQSVKVSFADAYTAMVNLQNEALKVREMCGDFIGLLPEDTGGANEDPKYRMFAPMDTIPTSPVQRNMGTFIVPKPNDVEFFLNNNFISEDMVNSVVRRHKPLM